MKTLLSCILFTIAGTIVWANFGWQLFAALLIYTLAVMLFIEE